MTQLRDELKKAGYTLSSKRTRSGEFYLQLDSLIYENFQTIIRFDVHDLFINVNLKRIWFDNQPYKEIEHVLYTVMNYLKEIGEQDTIKVCFYPKFGTYFYNREKELYTFSTKLEEKQTLTERVLAAIEQTVKQHIGLEMTYHIHNGKCTVHLREGILAKEVSYTLDCLAEEHYLLNDRPMTLEEMHVFFEKEIKTLLNKYRVKLLFDPAIQIRYIQERGFTLEQAHVLLAAYDFLTIQQLTVVNTQEIRIFEEVDSENIRTTRTTCFLLSDGSFLVDKYKCFHFSTVEAFMQQQQALKKKKLDRLREETHQKLAPLFDEH